MIDEIVKKKYDLVFARVQYLHIHSQMINFFYLTKKDDYFYYFCQWSFMTIQGLWMYQFERLIVPCDILILFYRNSLWGRGSSWFVAIARPRSYYWIWLNLLYEVQMHPFIKKFVHWYLVFQEKSMAKKLWLEGMLMEVVRDTAYVSPEQISC